MAEKIGKGNLRRSAKSPPNFRGAPTGAAAPPDLSGLGSAPPPAAGGDMLAGGGADAGMGMPMGGPAGGPALPPAGGLGVLGGGGAGFKPSDLVKKGQGKKRGK